MEVKIKTPASEANDNQTSNNSSQLTMEELNRRTVDNRQLKDQLKANEFSPVFCQGNEERERESVCNSILDCHPI